MFFICSYKGRGFNKHLLSTFINKLDLEGVLKVEASQKLRESSDHDPNHRYVDKR